MRFIMKCSTQSNLRVRVLASRALVGLVSNEKLQGVLLRIASALPSNGAQGGSFNYLHGSLLQLGNLLDTNCRDLVDESKKDQITGQLMDVLAKCTWMASCPCPILSTSFLRVLDHMRVIGRTCSESKSPRDIYKLHLDLSTNCLDADASYGFSYYDPTIAELREQAAVSYFGCVFQPSGEATEVFLTLTKGSFAVYLINHMKFVLPCNTEVVSAVSEVRRISSFSETSSIWNWAKNSLQVILLELLDKEKNHKCWLLYMRAQDVSNHQTTSSKSQNACDVYAYQILEMWFTCIKHLEDEDDLIRSKLATDVHKCFPAAMEVPTQVEKVLELSFNHLSSVFGHWNEYFQYLSRWVFNTADYTRPPKGSSDLVRRVFDNHHEEKLLILQLCCYHLQKLPNRDLSQAQLLEWRTKFQNQLLSFAKDHVGKQRESWVGGVGNHKDEFLPLYGNLLGLYVFSKCIFRLPLGGNDKKTLFSDMVELGEALKPFLRNPLVANMFRVVVELHEKSLEDLSNVLGGEIWEGFDPYFLIR